MRAPSRLVATAGLLLSLALAASDAWRVLEAGGRAAVAVQLLADLPLVAFFMLLLARPALLSRSLSRGAPFEPGDAGHVLAGALAVLTLQLLVGRSLTLFTLRLEGLAPAVAVARADLLGSTTTLAALSVGTALAWVGFVEGRRGRAAARALLLARPRSVPRALALGLALGAALVAGALALSLLWSALGERPDDSLARAMAASLGLAGILVVTALAAFHEELLFRGLLAPRLGLVAQAALFALAHGAYGTGLQLVVTLLVGLALGAVALRTRSLWAPVLAHGVFNLANFLLAGGYLDP